MRLDMATMRRTAARMLTDTGQVKVQTGTYTDPNTGAVVPQYDVFFDGPCLVTPTKAEARVVQSGEQAVTLKTYDVYLPADTEAPVDAKVTVTACRYDAALEGRELTILDSPADALQVTRHVVAVDTT